MKMPPTVDTIWIDHDAVGLAHLIVLAARPPRKGSLKRTEKALQVIDDVAGWLHFNHVGHEHPLSPRRGNRSFEDRRQSLALLFSDLDLAVRAGRRFRSSLSARKLGMTEPTVVEQSFEDDNDVFSFPLIARKHSDVIKEELEKSSAKGLELKNLRQDLWDRWLPTIHIGAAFSILLDSNEKMHGTLPKRDLLYWNVLFSQEPDRLVCSLVVWANQLEEEAARLRFFPKARLTHIS